ncbi:MAG TPA: DUF11 domain-containing protein [Candidatus Methanoperedenaceae archaeon]|nr:DUF11 domain-containing protein [Candidatus Methanoperedenaceae archaeon]
MIVTVALSGAASGEITREGLVAEYHFDIDASDSSGFKNDGVIRGGRIDDAYGGSLSLNHFSEHDEYVNVSHSESLNLSRTMTLEVIVNWGSTTDEKFGIVGKGDYSSQSGWALGMPDGGTKLRFYPSGGFDEISPFIEAPSDIPNRWVHYSVTYDGFELKMYIDGAIAKSVEYIGKISTNDQPITIGKWYDNYNANRFDGDITEVRIYNRSLSDIEIQNNHESFLANHPRITVTKTIESSYIAEGNQTNVKINFVNIGSTDAKNVRITDKIPDGCYIVNGTATKIYPNLSPSTSEEFQYSIKATTSGKFRTPIAEITYQDIKGNQYFANSNTQIISVFAKQNEEDAELQQSSKDLPKATGFENILSIIGLIVGTILRKKSTKI